MAKPQVILEQATKEWIAKFNGGDYDGSFARIRWTALNMRQTLWGCAEIASDDRKELLKRITAAEDGLKFALNVAENLEIPSGSFDGVSSSDPDDYRGHDVSSAAAGPAKWFTPDRSGFLPRV